MFAEENIKLLRQKCFRDTINVVFMIRNHNLFDNILSITPEREYILKYTFSLDHRQHLKQNKLSKY